MPTWKPAPPPCWETRFGSGGAQLLIRFLPSWYHANSSLVQEMYSTLYPTSLHGSLSLSETSSCLWVGKKWQMQLMWQQLTVVNEHNKAPQILSQLYLLFFSCQITLVYLPLTSLLSHFYCVSSTKIICLFYCLSVWCLSQKQTLSFSTNLINVTKCIPGTICMVNIL